ILEHAEFINNADPGECYWSDHWHYNLDLIESFAAIYPEQMEKLLLHKKVLTFYDNPHVVLPRSLKYVLFHNKPRQLDAVYINKKKESIILNRKNNIYAVRSKYGKGKIYKTHLLGKLLSLIANKYASLDPYGIGLEMESDKPDWCDALNGLPGTFGSSTSESFALKRFLLFLQDSLNKSSLTDKHEIQINEETVDFLKALQKATTKKSSDFHFWDETHNIKENYRQKTLFGVSGREKKLTIEEIKMMINQFIAKVSSGLEKAIDSKSGVIITNYEYIPTKYVKIKEKGKIKKNRNGHICIKVSKFSKNTIPLFLEGPVHYLRINKDKELAKKQHNNIMKSGLYDKELKMLKINAPLDTVDLSIGRIKIFTPGWLENESIWLHMEYKYLLELLRNKLYEEYYDILNTSLIPFLDPQVYGRSIFENSSFIVSSAHPEINTHGQGFVSRLSGSTAEFISMWIGMTSGLNPFFLDKENKLCLKFEPKILSKLFTKKQSIVTIYDKSENSFDVLVQKNSFLFKFLGNTAVIYHNPSRKNTYEPNNAKVSEIKLTYNDGRIYEIIGNIIFPPYAEQIREGKVKKIEIEMT
ncbi:hypothetical protein ACFL4O_02925, partial [bacterium]